VGVQRKRSDRSRLRAFNLRLRSLGFRTQTFPVFVQRDGFAFLGLELHRTHFKMLRTSVMAFRVSATMLGRRLHRVAHEISWSGGVVLRVQRDAVHVEFDLVAFAGQVALQDRAVASG